MAMTVDDLWRLHDELTVEEAARLVLDGDFDSNSSEYSENFCIVKDALVRAVGRREINFRVSEKDKIVFPGSPNFKEEITYIAVDSLKHWLKERGCRPSFFFPDTVDAPDYLNPDHPRYASKLAAAVEAWRNFTEVPGMSPKQALMRWLRENASRFGLTDSEGMPIAGSIDDIATVANWNQKGGAPKTPGETSDD